MRDDTGHKALCPTGVKPFLRENGREVPSSSSPRGRDGTDDTLGGLGCWAGGAKLGTTSPIGI